MSESEQKLEIVNKDIPAAEPSKEVFPQCPRCGWSTDPRLKPAEEDVKEYFRSVLGGRPFGKTYDLADGRIKMTFATITSAAQAELERVAASLDGMEEREANATGIRIRLLYHLRSIALEGSTLATFGEARLDSLEVVPVRYEAVFGALPGPLMDMAARTVLLFLELNRELLAAAFDENFWKGAGPR